jgi:hypothetical protein
MPSAGKSLFSLRAVFGTRDIMIAAPRDVMFAARLVAHVALDESVANLEG